MREIGSAVIVGDFYTFYPTFIYCVHNSNMNIKSLNSKLCPNREYALFSSSFKHLQKLLCSKTKQKRTHRNREQN